MSTLEGVVQGLVDDVSVARFKVGITWNPPHRWANDRYGYKMNYSRMHLLLVDQSPSKCGIYEAFLIRTFQRHAEIDNVKIGDDNRQNVSPHYIYLVTRSHHHQWAPVPVVTTRWTAYSNAPIAEPPAIGCGSGYIKPIPFRDIGYLPVTCSHTNHTMNIAEGGGRQ